MSQKSKKKETKKPDPALDMTGLAEDVLGGTSEGGPAGTEAGAGEDRIFEFADSLAREQEKSDASAKSQAIEERLETWVTFNLRGEVFGLPVTHVQEILRVTTITQVPHAPHSVRGVTNMRGRVLPVVDLRVRLDLEAQKTGEHSRVLVVSSHKRLLGLLVDSVQQVVRLDRNKVQPPPPDIMTDQSEYILGVYHLQEDLVILLDVDRVLLIKDSLQDREGGE